jgi:hypothetical protein
MYKESSHYVHTQHGIFTSVKHYFTKIDYVGMKGK